MAEQHARAVQQKRRQFTDFTSYEILLALALDMGRDGRPAKTGYRNLADRCGCHYNTVQTHIKRLEDDGWLRVEKEGKYHHYTVLVPADYTPEPSPVETEVCDNRLVTMEQRLSQLENKLSQLLSQIVTVNQSATMTEVKEVKEDKKGAGEIVTTDAYGQLKAAVSQATRKNITLLDESDLKHIDALFRAGYTAEQVRRFYGNGRKCNGWWHEQNWKGQKGQFPRIDDIVETIGEAVAFEEIPPTPAANGHHTNGSAPDKKQSLENIRKAVTTYGARQYKQAMSALQEPERAIVKNMASSWRDVCMMDKDTFQIKYYQALKGS